MSRMDKAKRYTAAVAVGAASIFLPQWDPDDHWATASLVSDIIAEEVAPDEPGGEPMLSFSGPSEIEEQWL